MEWPKRLVRIAVVVEVTTRGRFGGGTELDGILRGGGFLRRRRLLGGLGSISGIRGG